MVLHILADRLDIYPHVRGSKGVKYCPYNKQLSLWFTMAWRGTSNNNKNNKYNIHIHISGKGTDPENNRIICFPVIRGFAFDNGGHMSSARK